ncbi:hypothetical protein LTR78_007108 [Recurvomyces mirabilis]|uniref:Uncharacterized protein n=1 Tax=Recurvomyces mirabilis TaxID=574656 RepID=A0AAE0WJR4_9PEZI|nr:hypothetical protein LTR78_007108 [Recurvomyces mirabilis]KAK5150921.1 hypothetical protein LTS14_009724 [Recurvomyces mirabilis]
MKAFEMVLDVLGLDRNDRQVTSFSQSYLRGNGITTAQQIHDILALEKDFMFRYMPLREAKKSTASVIPSATKSGKRKRVNADEEDAGDDEGDVVEAKSKKEKSSSNGTKPPAVVTQPVTK